jgi:hypothetical protein
MQLFLKAVGLATVTALAQARERGVQLPGLTIPSTAAADRESVVQIFNDSYNAYRCAENTSMILFPNLSSVVVVENLLLVMMRWLR